MFKFISSLLQNYAQQTMNVIFIEVVI